MLPSPPRETTMSSPRKLQQAEKCLGKLQHTELPPPRTLPGKLQHTAYLRDYAVYK